MRHFLILSLATTMLFFTACGGGGIRTEQTLPIDQAVAVTNAEGVSAKMFYYKQSTNYLIVSFQFSNDTKEKIILKNDSGAQIAGLTATCEGRQINADRRGSGGSGWNPWTGVQYREGAATGSLEIAPGQKTELQVRWNYNPALSRKDYNWTVNIGNIYQGDKKLGDIAFAFDPKTAIK
jgi:hypothetical protein